MPEVHIGSSSEYIKIALPPSFATEGWAQAEVQICVNGFKGHIQPWVEAADFESFAVELQGLYDSLEGNAQFRPREEQLTLSLSAKTGGHIQVFGTAWSKATHENKLEFLLELDQSFLSEPLQALQVLLAASKRGAA